jgi:hypothetical protein
MDQKNNSGVENSGNWNSGDWNSGNRNSGDCNSGNCNSGDCNSGNCNSGNWNSGNRNSGNRNSGDWNSGNCNFGYFNSTKSPLRLFNKFIDQKEIDFPYINLELCQWISEENMTDKEKIDHPKFYITKGYLKTIEYQTAWKLAWNKMSTENKSKITSLPGFDEVIFYDITGIDLKCDINKKKQDLMEEAQKLLNMGQEFLNKAKQM